MSTMPDLFQRVQSRKSSAAFSEARQQDNLQSGCVPQLVAAQAVAAPDAIAVTDGKLSLTYRQLNERADHLAHVLRSLGVGPDLIVGLYVPRSLAMLVGALGILKAGGAYLPLDPAQPIERLAFFLKDAAAPIVVTLDSLVAGLPAQPEHVVALDLSGCPSTLHSSEPIAVETQPKDLAYVIYTSGSTGQPKGVELTHGSLANLVHWHNRAFSVTREDRASQLAALSFDASVWEVWPYLTAGATIHLSDCLARSEPQAIRDWLISQEITICFLPTPIAERVIALEWPPKIPLRVMLTGADTLHHHPPRTLPFHLVNNYGPTECTVVATSGTVLSDEYEDGLPTIGRPIDNTEIYILNENMREVQLGGRGEIYVGGAGLARGYHNRPDLTAERFVSNPFSAESGARLYRTGDLARYLPDGQIAFLGRVDDQVKIRGYRIEPAEIVKVLDEHPAVQASVVVAREIEPGDKRLVAYLKFADGARATHTEMHNFVAARLPEYMIPATFVALPELSCSVNGKLDRARLPVPAANNILRDNPPEDPETAIEQQTEHIIAGLLQIESVGRDENFFMLGGHSLLGIQLIVQLRNAFDVELPLRTLFEKPTVAELSQEIEAAIFARIGAGGTAAA